MFSSRMIASVSAALALASLSSVMAVPVPGPAPLASRAVSIPSPAFVTYSDKFVDQNVLPPASELAGFNVINLSFFIVSKGGPFDQAAAFANLPADQRAAKKAEYAAAGINLLVSAFGDADQPTTNGVDPVDIANKIAQFVTDTGLDGVDVDYEDFTAMNKGDGAAEKWVSTFSQAIRQKLPQGQFILSHAPIAAWLAPNTGTAGGAYVTVNKNVGSLIDWYNVQYYNQADPQTHDPLYVTCDTLINKATGFPGTALFELPNNGFDVNKIVIGKPGSSADAGIGFMDPSTLGSCVDTAAGKGWHGGIMGFQMPDVDSAFIKAAKGTAFQ